MGLIIGLIIIVIIFKSFSDSQSRRSRASSRLNRAKELHNKSDYRGRVSKKDMNAYHIGIAEDERNIRRRHNEIMDPLKFIIVLVIILFILKRLSY